MDLLLDCAAGLPFDRLSHIFGEHFIEHLTLPGAIRFLNDARRVLRPDGVLRLSTPNLDWVWASHYRAQLVDDEAMVGCLEINRAFHGWGHQFLYNEVTLTFLLHATGFAHVRRCTWRKR